MTDTLHIASGPNTETYTPYQLLAGDTPPVASNDFVVTANLAFAQNEIVAQIDGKIVKWAPAEETTAAIPFAIAKYAIASGAERREGFYAAGCFNVDALVWPAAVATMEARQAAMAGTGFQVRKLFFSGDTAHGSV